MGKDKHIEEKEKLETEISRSLSVAKMKAAHKQIEEIEKSRKRSVIVSVIERLDINIRFYKGIIDEFNNIMKKTPEHLLNVQLPTDVSLDLNNVVKIYESVYFDFKKSTDIKPEDLDKLFPKIIIDFSTLTNLISTLVSISVQMMNMKAYCLRLL